MMKNSDPRVGVFVLANDRVVDWFSAFVASFREYSLYLPLRLIPFDEQSSRCESLVRQAGGEVYRDDAAFERLERVGRMLEIGKTATGPHWFRRFVAFDGPFDAFAYLDCRMLVLADVSGFAAAACSHDVPLVHYDAVINQVYNDGPVRTSFCRQGLGHGFSSNIWASRKGLFSLEQMEAAGKELVAVRDQMNPRNTDQFFLNYLCDSHGLRACHIADLDSRLAHSAWANDRGAIYEDADGIWRKWDFGGLQHRRQMLFLHWAGIRLHPAMPHFSIYRRFRRPRRGPLGLAFESVSMGAGKIVHAMRSNRWLNTGYHRLRSWAEGQR
jgi:hypothetical protein